MQNMVKLITRNGCEKILIDKEYGASIITAIPRSRFAYDYGWTVEEAMQHENETTNSIREFRRADQYLVTVYEEV